MTRHCVLYVCESRIWYPANRFRTMACRRSTRGLAKSFSRWLSNRDLRAVDIDNGSDDVGVATTVSQVSARSTGEPQTMLGKNSSPPLSGAQTHRNTAFMQPIEMLSKCSLDKTESCSPFETRNCKRRKVRNCIKPFSFNICCCPLNHHKKKQQVAIWSIREDPL